MKDERYDNIEYNDGWQSVPVVRAKPIDYENYDEDDENDDIDENGWETQNLLKDKIKMRSENPQPVIKLQFLLSLLIIAIAFLLKNFGGDFYSKAKELYFENLNSSLVVTLPENFLNFDNDK